MPSNVIPVFFDLEFTGLHQYTTPVSIALVPLNNRKMSFYAEFTDYERGQVDKWLQENVIDNLVLSVHGWDNVYDVQRFRGTRGEISWRVVEWLYQLSVDEGGVIQMCGDVPSYDWVLFCSFFEPTVAWPDWINYIPFDLATLLWSRGIDPDIDRHKFAEMQRTSPHNALDDAQVLRRCYMELLGSGEYQIR